MGLWEELQRITGSENAAFHGFDDTTMIVMLQELSSHANMRFDSEGRPLSLSQRNMFETSFRHNFHLSPEQFTCIADLHDRFSLDDITSARAAALPSPVVGGRPAYVSRVFSSSRTMCCGRTLRVRCVFATVYGRDSCFPAWNIVKTCREGCGARYWFDRKVLGGTFEGNPCDWIIYNAWGDGSVPTHIGTKSSRSIFCWRYLTGVAIDRVTMG